MGDVNKNTIQKINLAKYIKKLNDWQEIVIPFSEMNWLKFDKKQFKELRIMVDDDHSEGELIVYIDNFEFSE